MTFHNSFKITYFVTFLRINYALWSDVPEKKRMYIYQNSENYTHLVVSEKDMSSFYHLTTVSQLSE